MLIAKRFKKDQIDKSIKSIKGCACFRIAENRTRFVFDVIPLMFNNTDYLFFLTQEQTNEVGSYATNKQSIPTLIDLLYFFIE